MAPSPIAEGEKSEYDHIEHDHLGVEQKGVDVHHTDQGVIIKSPFEDLSFWNTLKTFRKASVLGLLAAFSASAE